MKGYYTAYGYMGFVNGRYMLFASESDYKDYVTTWHTGRGFSSRPQKERFFETP